MWTFEKHLKLKSNHSRCSISSIQAKGSRIYMGTTDGRIITDRYELQSHEREFDYLESSDINEKINSVALFSSGSFHENLATCNEKCIKIWRARPQATTFDILQMGYRNLEHEKPNLDSQEEEKQISYKIECIKCIKNVHDYSINSLSINTSENFLLSSDYLRINLWCTQNMKHCVNLIDSKPKRYEELEFVITKCLFKNNSVFGYGTTNGMVSINDLRISPLSMRIKTVSARKNSLSDELTGAISDFKFFDENYLVTRDLNSLAIYDLRSEKTEIKRYRLFETQKSFLEEFLNKDTESDWFSMGMCDNKIVTGGYGAQIYMISPIMGTIETILLDVSETDGTVEHCAMSNNRFVCSYKDGAYTYKYSNNQQ